MFVVLASLSYLKEHTVYEEQEEIVLGMNEREHLLQKEGAKLEQEVHSVAMEPPQVSQSHHRLTKGEGEESDVQQILPNGKAEEPHEHQMPARECQDLLHHNPLTGDNRELQTDKTVAKLSPQAPDLSDTELNRNLSPEEVSKIALPSPNETKQIPPKGSQEGEVSMLKKEDPANDTKALGEDQASVLSKVVQSSHLNQVETIDQPKTPEEGIPQEEHKSFFQQIADTFIYRWSRDSQEVHASLDNESSEQPQVQDMHRGEQMSHTDESVSKFNQEDSKEVPRAEQQPSQPSQVQTKASQKEHLGSEDIYTWYLWKVLSLVSVIRLLRKFIGRKSKTSGKAVSIMEDKKRSGSTSKLALLSHKVLSSFYDQCVWIPPGTREQVCDFVEGFVDELLEAARNNMNKGTDMEIGDFVGVGSLYELWATGKAVVCDLYVPITAPRSCGFDTELDMPGCGRIKLVKAENTSNGCACNDGTMEDDDMLCLLHPHKETNSVITDVIGGPLCQENTPYLSKTRVIRWFRKTISKAWEGNSHKYEFELAFRNQAAPGALKVRLRSGQVILFNITPVVQVKGTDLYLVPDLSSEHTNTSDSHWPISLASYEKALLQHFSKSLPTDSCHIQCLQVLSFLHKQQNRLTGKCGLTSYHLKITLLHLLLETQPLEWKSDQLAGRLTDLLIFLEQSLHARKFHHSLVGNPLVPSSIGLPKEVLVAKPANIFLPLVSDKELYLKTVQHLQELVKNAPVLMQEYVSVKSSGVLD